MLSVNDVRAFGREISTPSPGQKSAQWSRRGEGMNENQFVPEFAVTE